MIRVFDATKAEWREVLKSLLSSQVTCRTRLRARRKANDSFSPHSDRSKSSSSAAPREVASIAVVAVMAFGSGGAAHKHALVAAGAWLCSRASRSASSPMEPGG